MKNIILILFLCAFSFPVSSQQEVYFSNKKAEDIKVENLQGIDFAYSPSGLLSSTALNLPISFSYFHESRLAPCWTLNKTIGLQIYASHIDIYKIDTVARMYHFTGKKWVYNLGLSGRIEPRWYWQYKDRVIKGKHSTLNSGWFLSFPLSLSTGLIHSPFSTDNTWFYHSFSLETTFYPSLGYRYALSNKIFLESKLGTGPHFDFGQVSSCKLDYSLEVRIALKF